MLFKTEKWIKERNEKEAGLIDVSFNDGHNVIKVFVYPPLNENDVIETGKIWDSEQEEFYDPYQTFLDICLFAQDTIHIEKTKSDDMFDYVNSLPNEELSQCSFVRGKVKSIETTPEEFVLVLKCFGAEFHTWIKIEQIDRAPKVGDVLSGMFSVIGL